MIAFVIKFLLGFLLGMLLGKFATALVVAGRDDR